MILELPDDMSVMALHDFAREHGLTLRWAGQRRLKAQKRPPASVTQIRTVKRQQPTFDGPSAA